MDKNKKLQELKALKIRLDRLPLEEQIKLLLEMNGFIEKILPPKLKEFLNTLRELANNGNDKIRAYLERATKEIIDYLQQYIDDYKDE